MVHQKSTTTYLTDLVPSDHCYFGSVNEFDCFDSDKDTLPPPPTPHTPDRQNTHIHIQREREKERKSVYEWLRIIFKHFKAGT